MHRELSTEIQQGVEKVGPRGDLYARPITESGCLLDPSDRPMTPESVHSAVLEKLSEHLGRVCLWGPSPARLYKQIGEYSYYIISCEVRGEPVFVKFWSEPGDSGICMEVSTRNGSGKHSRDRWARWRERILDHGFGVAEHGPNLRKTLTFDSSADISVLARESVAILTRIFGYNGTTSLQYELHLGTRLDAVPVLTSVTRSEVEKLIRAWRFTVYPTGKPKSDEVDESKFSIERGDVRCTVDLLRSGGLSEGCYDGIHLVFGAVANGRNLRPLCEHINSHCLATTASIDVDGDLMVDRFVMIAGGVTSTHLEIQLNTWYATLHEIVSDYHRLEAPPNVRAVH